MKRDIEGVFVRIFKIGSEDHPASADEINDLDKVLKNCYEMPSKELLDGLALMKPVKWDEEAI